jgi:hypothetical protein
MNSDNASQVHDLTSNGGFWNNGRFAPSGGPTFGNSVALTYSFTTSLPGEYNGTEEDFTGYTTFTATQMTVVRNVILPGISELINVSFTEVTGALVNDPVASDIRFSNTTQPDSGGFAYYAGTGLSDSTTSQGKAQNGQAGLGGDVFMAAASQSVDESGNTITNTEATQPVIGDYAFASHIH